MASSPEALDFANGLFISACNLGTRIGVAEGGFFISKCFLFNYRVQEFKIQVAFLVSITGQVNSINTRFDSPNILKCTE